MQQLTRVCPESLSSEDFVAHLIGHFVGNGLISAKCGTTTVLHTSRVCRILAIAGFLLAQLISALAAEGLDDTIFKAMSDELARSMSLRLEGLDAPYFLQYEVVDGTTYRVSAAYGALLRSHQSRSRTLFSQLRVGSEALDNSNFGGGRLGGGRSGLTASAGLPTDDDYLAIRHAIWHATDTQFKEALETLTRKRAYLKDRTVEDRPPDFSKATSTNAMNALPKLSFDQAKWEEFVRQISARCRDFKSLENAEVDLVAGVENRYLVNSETTRLRDGETETLLRISLEGQSEDGEWLSDHLSYFAPTPEELPPASEVLTALSELGGRLDRALHAPLLEDYTGPVLFDGLAAPQLFRQLLGAGLTGLPDPVGSPRRSAQGSEDLDNRLGKRILPQTFQIYDDPREAKYENTFLAGHYLEDDEGVPAQRVNLVTDGKLEGMVMSRTPTKHFSQTNGHGRRGGSETPRAALGSVYIESSKSLNPDDLKKELLAAADREGLKYGLRITAMQSRSGAGRGGGPGGRFRRGAAGGAGRTVGDPIYVYKVFVADGHEEPVRGCEFSSFDLQSLKRILATGNVRTVQNNVIGATPSSSVIAPAVLIGEVELSQIRAEGERKPILQSPLNRNSQ
jgi:predicted Zn-dependent protease